MAQSRQSPGFSILPPKPQTFGLPTRPATHGPAPKPASPTSSSRMVDKTAKRTSRIEIPLPCRPGPYRPGDGPSPAPLRILLQNDSNAIIHDKRVLPGEPKNDKLSLQMYYIIGWPDLPAARVAINAKYIFDYVSPRTLEDYEYRLLLEKEEKERIAEEKASQEEAQSSRPDATSTQWTAPLGKKKKGRPSKAQKLAQKIEEETSLDSQEAVAIEEELPPVSGGPSLSTPKKKLADVVMEMEEIQDTEAIEDSESETGRRGGEEEDDEIAILKQLHGMEETQGRKLDDKKGDVEDDSDDSDEILEEHGASHPPQNPAPQKGPSLAKQPVPAKAISILPPARYQQRQEPTAISPSRNPMKLSPKKETPILPPSKFSLRPEPASAPMPKNTLMSYGFTPAGRSSGKWPSVEPTTPATASKAEKSKSKSKKQLPGNPPSKKRKQNDGSALPPFPPLPPPPSQAEDDDAIEVAGVEDQVWEVKCLEGDAIQTDPQTGRGVRLYLVRWKGNWPPDQNPTWEPEENIERALVRKYLKQKAKKEDKSRTSSTPSSSLLRRKYSSVAEAFEDEEHEEDFGFSPASSSRGRGHRIPASGTSRKNGQQWSSNQLKSSQRSSPLVPSLGPQSSGSGKAAGGGFWSENDNAGGGDNHGFMDDEGEEEEEKFLVAGDEDNRRTSSFGSASLLARELEASFGSSARR